MKRGLEEDGCCPLDTGCCVGGCGVKMARETPREKMEMGGGTEEEVEERRREAALAAAPLLQPGFKSSKVSQFQLDKFRELHNRRLQIKEGSKDRRRSRGNANGSARGQKKEVDVKECEEKNTTALLEDSNIPIAKGKPHLSPDEAANSLAPKKRQKLYWGLDTKERWERKSNM